MRVARFDTSCYPADPVRPSTLLSTLVCVFMAAPGCGYIGIEHLDGDADAVGGTSASKWSGGSGGQVASGGSAAGGGGNESGGTPGFGGMSFCDPDCEGLGELLTHFDFEAGLPQVQLNENPPTVILETENPRSGDSALRLEQAPGRSQARIVVELEAEDPPELFFRSWLYVPSGTVTGAVRVLSLNNQDFVGTDIVLESDGRIGLRSQIDDRDWNSTLGAYPYDEWFCLHVGIFSHDLAGEAEVAINGEVQVEAFDFDTRPGNGVNSIGFGLLFTGSGQEGAVLLIDDVVIAEEPIPCSP